MFKDKSPAMSSVFAFTRIMLRMYVYVRMYVWVLGHRGPSRMKLRSPPLPNDLVVIWDYFILNVPSWLWKSYTVKDMAGNLARNTLGLSFLKQMQVIQEELGEHFKPNPAKPPLKKPKLAGGNPDAFSNWIYKIMKENKGRVSM